MTAKQSLFRLLACESDAAARSIRTDTARPSKARQDPARKMAGGKRKRETINARRFEAATWCSLGSSRQIDHRAKLGITFDVSPASFVPRHPHFCVWAREAGPSICRRLVPSMPPPASPLPRQPHRPRPTPTHHYQNHHRARHPPPPKCAGAPLDPACARARGRAALARLPHGRGVQARAEADAQDERDREGRARLRHRRFRSMLTRMPPGPLYVLYVRPRVRTFCEPC